MSGGPTALQPVQQWMQDALVFPRRVEREAVEAMLAIVGPAGRRRTGWPSISAAISFASQAACASNSRLCAMRSARPCSTISSPIMSASMPPESHTLYDLGRRFPAFLEEAGRTGSCRRRSARPGSTSWSIWPGSSARSSRCSTRPGTRARPFADAATPDRRLRLQPCFALGAYRFPVAAYYHAVRLDEPAPLPPAGGKLRGAGAHRLCDPHHPARASRIISS